MFAVATRHVYKTLFDCAVLIAGRHRAISPEGGGYGAGDVRAVVPGESASQEVAEHTDSHVFVLTAITFSVQDSTSMQ